MHGTGWSRGLEVTGGGTGVVSHAGLVLLRSLADRTLEGTACIRLDATVVQARRQGTGRGELQRLRASSAARGLR